ncbi:PAAR-like domain-containing protein [Methylomarinum vadi]|uniref:PAAR-like domain-containing protein n=1 Tax=Methylomarinum vadi TaxID=438855 RepID=UPI0006909F79|nr:PAAR-like domain-containing protein [Methylomarinum vadi]
MANDVFANGREISCKKADGKSICAFPDVCFTPPENPATPPGVPVPYPNTAFAKDTTSGSKKVKISGQEVMLKNKSYFKTSTGDEAGCAAKKGVITSKIKGKAYFVSWSMDVKVEGENVVRHLDMTTHNHASPMANDSVPWAHVDQMYASTGQKCDKIVAEIHPYDKRDCPQGSQSHHIIDNACFVMEGGRNLPLYAIESAATGQQKRNIFQPGSGHPAEKYDQNKAPCICLEGHATIAGTEHNIAHGQTSRAASRKCTSDGKSKFGDLKSDGAKSIKKAKGLEEWEAECIELVLEAYFKDFEDDTEVAAPGQDCTATHFNNGSGTMCHASELV